MRISDWSSDVCSSDLAFDGTGACVVNPHGPVLKSMAVRAYPTLTAYRGIWIWMGDPELADPALLPDLSFVDRTPETAFSNGYVCGKGDYRLFVDNIMRSEEHTSELQSLMRISYAVFCLKK